MSTGKVTCDEIERVKILIEKCIMKYMKRKEVIHVLYQQHNIEPCFTKIVWKNLEEQNKDFFRNYGLRLTLKDQITKFNNLLDKQASTMKQLKNPTACPPSNLGVQPVLFDLPPNNSFDYPFNTLLAQNSDVGMNSIGILVKNESASVSSSSNMDSNSHSLKRTFMDEFKSFLSPHPDYTSFGSNGIIVNNQGENFTRVTSISSNLDFQNSRFVESQRSNIVWRRLEDGSL